MKLAPRQHTLITAVRKHAAANYDSGAQTASECGRDEDCPEGYENCPDATDPSGDCVGHPCGCGPDPVLIEETRGHTALAVASAGIAQALATLIATGH